MFTSEEREQNLQVLVDYFSSIYSVKALILGGELASKNYDEYSGIDLSIIVEDGGLEKIWFLAENFIKSKLDYFNYFKQVNSDKDLVICILLNNFLEINLNFLCQKRFEEKHMPNALTLYARSGLSLELEGDKKALDIDRLLTIRINDVWFDFKHALISLKRNQIFKASGYIEKLRDQILQMYTTMFNLENVEDFDALSAKVKQKVMAAHFSNYTTAELRQSVINYLTLFVQILDACNRKEEGQKYREKFENFLKI